MVVEFTVQERPEKQFVLVIAVHLLGFSPPVMLFGFLCTAVAMVCSWTGGWDNSPFSHGVKHLFSESLETHKPPDQNTSMFLKRFLCPGWVFIMYFGCSACFDSCNDSSKETCSKLLSVNTNKGIIGAVWIPWHLNWNTTWKIWRTYSEIWYKNASKKSVYFHAEITLPQIGSCY